MELIRDSVELFRRSIIPQIHNHHRHHQEKTQADKYIFIQIRIHSKKAEQPLQDRELKERQEDKHENHIGKPIRKIQKMKGTINSTLQKLFRS